MKFYNFLSQKIKFIVKKPPIIDKKDLIKNLNYENKSLYGAVQKKSKENNKIQDEIPEESSMKSEMYWMTQYVHKPEPIKPKTSKKKLIKLKDPSIVNDEILPSSTKKKLKKKKVEKISIENSSDSIVKIPFTNDELKAMPMYPLFLPDKPTIIENLKIDHVPSVGKILQATMSDSARSALMKWKLLKIAELGETGFEDLQKRYLSHGSLFHSSIENYLKLGEIPESSSEIYETWKSVNPILSKISYSPIIETHLIHSTLHYKGVVDCIGQIDDELYIIEWKKSDRLKPNIFTTYDAPLQLCAYLGAINSNTNYNFNIKKGGVIVAYTNGKPADFHRLDLSDLRKYWMAWLQRLQEYWIRYRDGTLPEPI